MTSLSTQSVHPRLQLAAVITTVCGFAFSAGLLYPVIALALDHRGVAEDMIGLNTAMVGLGVIVSAFFIPRLCARYGGWAMLYVGAAGAILSLAAMALHYDFWIWCLLRFLEGAFINGLYVIGEAWISAIAREETRGRTIALYTTVMGASFAAGPAMVPLVGYQDALPFVVTAVVIALSVLPMAGYRREDPLRGDIGDPRGRLGPVLRRGAPMMLAVLGFGIMDGATLGLMPVYALEKGLSGDAASLPLTVLVVGAVGLQYPVGWLTDRVGPRQALVGCAAVTAACGAALPLLTLGSLASYAVIVLWGGASFAIFTVSLTLLGRRFRGPALAAGSAGLTMMWGVGAILGPWAVGVGMAAAGPDAMPLMVAGAFLVLALVLAGLRGAMPTRAEAAGTTEG